MSDALATGHAALTTGDVARLLGVSRSHVHSLDDALRPSRVGSRGLRVYSSEVVIEYLRQRERDASAKVDALRTLIAAAETNR